MVALRVPKTKAKSRGAAELSLRPQTVLAKTPLYLAFISATDILCGLQTTRHRSVFTESKLCSLLRQHNLSLDAAVEFLN